VSTSSGGELGLDRIEAEQASGEPSVLLLEDGNVEWS